MTSQMIITLAILAGSAVLFVSGKVRSDLVAVSSLILLVLFGILTPGEALSGFSNSIVIMMIGLFVVGGGIFRTGLAKMASGKLLQLAGTNETRLLITVMLATAALGAFVSNTGTVAVMLPIVVSLAAAAGVHPGRLLMPLAFASSLGGMLTMIGTPPNLVIRETLAENGYGELSFFAYTPIGLVCLATGVAAMIIFGRWLLPKGERTEKGRSSRPRSLQELASQYELSRNLYRVRVDRSSAICGQTLRDLNIPEQYMLSIIEIRRKSSLKNPFFKTIAQELAGPDTVVQENDILYVVGGFDQVRQFADICELELIDRHVPELSSASEAERLSFHEIGIAEVLLTPNSGLANQLIKHSGFREKFGVNILGIHRKGEYIVHNLKDEKMRIGDALLVQGTWRSIGMLSQEQADVVVVGQPLEQAIAVTIDHKAPIAGAIMLLMVVVMIADIIPAVIAVMIAALLMIVTGCLRNMEEAYKTINWESVVLIGGMIPLSAAIEKTGAARLLSESLVGLVGDLGPVVLLAGIYLAVSTLTLFISNTASAVLFAPIALTAAVQMGVSPIPYMFAVSIAASMSFATPFSTPPNALVMSAGRYKFTDYVKVGVPLQIVIGIVIVSVLPMFFPF